MMMKLLVDSMRVLSSSKILFIRFFDRHIKTKRAKTEDERGRFEQVLIKRMNKVADLFTMQNA